MLSLTGAHNFVLVLTGNTDTASYWNLTKHIYRYVGGPVEDYEGNEHSERHFRFDM